MIIRWQTIFNKIIDPKIDADLPRSLAKRVRMSHGACLGLGTFSVIYMIIFLMLGSTFSAMTCLVAALAYGLAMWCNRWQMYAASRLLCMLSSNLAILLFTWLMGSSMDVKPNFLAMSVVPFVLFDRGESRLLIGSVALSIICYIVAQALDAGPPQLELSQATFDTLSELSAPSMFCLLLASVYYLHKSNAQAEEQLAATLAHLMAQQEQMLATAKLSALGEMASGIAHEINNPLAIIAGRAGNANRLLTPGAAVDRGKLLKIIGDIQDTTRRIAKIVNGLRAFSRNGEQDGVGFVALSAVIDDTLALCTERFKNAGVELRVKLPMNDHLVECRSVQISQSLLNLLSNAFDAVEAASDKWVEIDVQVVGEGYQIRVIDSGPGIAGVAAERLFLPFFTTKPAGKGTGLGLSITKKIIEDHHGSLHIDARSAHTAFVIWLPKLQPSANGPNAAKT